MNAEPDACPICLDPLQKKAKTLGCGHSFHAACIRGWFARAVSCPCCRRGSVDAIKRGRNVAIDTAFARVLARAPFPAGMSDHERIVDILACDKVMDAFRVSVQTRPFLLVLSGIANDVPHFLDMLRRLRPEFR
jgi:hypothetical protein